MNFGRAELVPDNVSSNDLKDEAHRRSARAGYTSRAGERLYRTKIMAAPPNKRYEENYDKIDWSNKEINDGYYA